MVNTKIKVGDGVDFGRDEWHEAGKPRNLFHT